MGAKLCTLHQSSSVNPQHQHDTDDDSSTDTNVTFMDLLKPKCLRKETKKLHQQEKKIGKSRKLTLEEWLLSSPGLERDCSPAGGAQVRRHSPKVSPLLPTHHTGISTPTPSYVHLSSTPRESFSIDGEISLSRSQSGQKKKVSFRLPEEADIHLIHYPHQDDSE